MAAGKASDFVIYNEQYYTGLLEAMDQQTQIFNAASNGALEMVNKDLLGDYESRSFLKSISGLTRRRDTTSVAAVADTAMTMDQFISVKINRGIGPMAQTLDAWRKIGKDSAEMSLKLGRMIGAGKLQDYANTMILAVAAALDSVAALTYDATALATPTLTPTTLANGMAKMGDMASNIVCWVMHSKNYFDLVKQAIADKIYNEAGVVVYGGLPGTLGLPVVVIDAPGLTDSLASQTNDTYNVLGLVSGAAALTESEPDKIVAQEVTGYENLMYRIQGEYAFNLGVKGFKWDVTNGGVNPTDAALGISTNWDKVATSVKNCCGVRIVCS
jgi:hypothetical protein